MKINGELADLRITHEGNGTGRMLRARIAIVIEEPSEAVIGKLMMLARRPVKLRIAPLKVSRIR